MLGAFGAANTIRPCNFCRFRSRRLALEFRRARHKSPSKELKIRFTGGRSATPALHPERRNGHGANAVWRLTGGRSSKHFDNVLKSRIETAKDRFKDSQVVSAFLGAGSTEKGSANFDAVWERLIRRLGLSESSPSAASSLQPSEQETLRRDWEARGPQALDRYIEANFFAVLSDTRFTESELRHQRGLADLRYPSEWYPATRTLRRKIHLHVGPTNSGKTYHALKRLEQSKKGVFAGPLRLLAHEVYSRMNAKNIKCTLVTGEEKRFPTAEGVRGQDLFSCTVEMVPYNVRFDVAVIDEIQMLGHADRGWAWTAAFLAIQADEIHLCGEARTVPLISELCASLGEKLTIHHYERLSPLNIEKRSLGGDLSKLRKGDCVVSFSVMSIHALRRAIENQTGKKVAIVYGSLPPETRAQQAALFNDPDNDYDYLVASDAIGMGLNLAIKRVIFEAVHKYDGQTHLPLAVAEIKQIAGRAGRYRTAQQASQTPERHQDLSAAKGEAGQTAAETRGFVTTLEKFDYPLVASAMGKEPEPLNTAGVHPPNAVVEMFATYFPPKTPFSYILTRLHELSTVHSRFHLCQLDSLTTIADSIESVEGLSIRDRNIICAIPFGYRDKHALDKVLPVFAQMIADQRACTLADIEEIPLEIMDRPMSTNKDYLMELESLHRTIVGYLWLSFRFPGVFASRQLATYAKGLVETRIGEVLQKFSFSEKVRKSRAAKREQMMKDVSEMLSAAADAAGGSTLASASGEDDGIIDGERELDSPAVQDGVGLMNLGLEEWELEDGDDDADVEEASLDDDEPAGDDGELLPDALTNGEEFEGDEDEFGPDALLDGGEFEGDEREFRPAALRETGAPDDDDRELGLDALLGDAKLEGDESDFRPKSLLDGGEFEGDEGESKKDALLDGGELEGNVDGSATGMHKPNASARS